MPPPPLAVEPSVCGAGTVDPDCVINERKASKPVSHLSSEVT
jgi:hypothetical protein